MALLEDIDDVLTRLDKGKPVDHGEIHSVFLAVRAAEGYCRALEQLADYVSEHIAEDEHMRSVMAEMSAEVPRQLARLSRRVASSMERCGPLSQHPL